MEQYKDMVFLNDTLLTLAIAVSIILAASFIIFHIWATRHEGDIEEDKYYDEG